MDVLKCGGFQFIRNPSLDDNRLEGLNIALANSIVCDSLSVDTADAELYSKALLPVAYSTADRAAYTTADGKVFCVRGGKDLRSIPYGSPVEYYRDGKLFARLYKQSIRRTGKTIFELSATSSIGLLSYMQHRGGIYHRAPFPDVLADILGGAITYTVDDALKSVLIWGWLPYASKRDNLRQLLMATGASIRKDSSGNVVFSFLDAGDAAIISADSIYQGGSVTNGSPATGVDVTSHTYVALAADQEVTLYDNTDGSDAAEYKEVAFSNPVHDLASTGSLTVHDSGANYAVVSGSGTLTGLAYTHQTDIVSLRVDSPPGQERIISVTDCTLVSVANAENVAQRILAYYSAAERIEADIIVGAQRPGDAVELLDPFDEQSRGMLETMDINVSGTLKASTSIITGYMPTGMGNYYDHVMVVTKSGTVTIPAEAKGKAQLVLISGGPGGSSGYAGETLEAKTENYNNTSSTGVVTVSKAIIPPGPAAGGKPGDPGSGARILRVTINVTAGQVLTVTIGAGGTGGLFTDGENTPGQSGGDTVVAGYSTANAAVTATGYYDQINGVLYGAPGSAGAPGGASAGRDLNAENTVIPAESISAFGQIFRGGASVGTANEVSKEAGSANTGYGYRMAAAYGSFGGGAAYGRNGDDGSMTGAQASVSSTGALAKGAVGGKGADALPPPTPDIPGTGGYGGNGGGGAGPCGEAYAENIYNSDKGAQPAVVSVTANTMIPGNGSDGGKGADGALLIYY